ncbi:MAG: hypothetical protein AB2610_01530 [Candidatus Thiodiazotropha sp.]
MSIYAPRVQQLEIRKWLDKFNSKETVCVTLTYSKYWMNRISRSIGFTYRERLRAYLINHLDDYLHYLNKHYFGNAFRRFNKRLPIVPVIEGDNLVYDYHFHLGFLIPERITLDDFRLEARKKWRKGMVDVQQEPKGYWLNYITKLDTKDFDQPYTDSILYECM